MAFSETARRGSFSASQLCGLEALSRPDLLNRGNLEMRRPQFIADQARNARGLLGRLIAFIMARETWRENLRVMDILSIEQGDQVLDIGCGHGRSLMELAARAPRGHIVGVDPSGLMVEIAKQRNRPLIEAARVDVILSSVESLPFPDDVFDKALCVHVLYFWQDIETSLREIARVLKPGGRLGLLFRTNADLKAISSFPPEIYRFPALADVSAALDRAGMDVHVAGDGAHEPALVLARKRRA
jgi:SAM-dependent methyltransferase